MGSYFNNAESTKLTALHSILHIPFLPVYSLVVLSYISVSPTVVYLVTDSPQQYISQLPLKPDPKSIQYPFSLLRNLLYVYIPIPQATHPSILKNHESLSAVTVITV